MTRRLLTAALVAILSVLARLYRHNHPLHLGGTMTHPRTIAVVLVALSLTLASCGDNDSDTATTATAAGFDPSSTSTESSTTVAASNRSFAQLCAALDAARVSDLDGVRATFDHGPLHELADKAIDVDRSVAARLLEAKEAVESDLAQPDITAAEVASDLDALTASTAAAYAAIGEPVPSTCDEESP